MLLYNWWTLNIFHICFLGDLTLDLGAMYSHSFSPPFNSCYHPSYSISFQCNLWNVSLVKHINMNPTHFHIFDTRKVKHEQYYTEETIGGKKPHNIFIIVNQKAQIYGFLSSLIECNFMEFSSWFTDEIQVVM